MTTPSIVSVSTGRYVEAKQGTPTASVTANAASWGGTSMAPQRSFPTLAAQSFVGKANGLFNVVDASVGPRVGAARGTIDAWFKMGTGADSIVIAQSVASTTTAPLITLGVDSSGKATGSIQDANGTTVAAWDATTMTGVAAGGMLHLQLAWDATTAIDGLYHVKVKANDVQMPQASFTTAPLANWTSFQPTYLSTGTMTQTGFDGEMILTQTSLKVVI